MYLYIVLTIYESVEMMYGIKNVTSGARGGLLKNCVVSHVYILNVRLRIDVRKTIRI